MASQENPAQPGAVPSSSQRGGGTSNNSSNNGGRRGGGSNTGGRGGNNNPNNTTNRTNNGATNNAGGNNSGGRGGVGNSAGGRGGSNAGGGAGGARGGRKYDDTRSSSGNRSDNGGYRNDNNRNNRNSNVGGPKPAESSTQPKAQPSEPQPASEMVLQNQKPSDSQKKALDLVTNWQQNGIPLNILPYLPRDAWASLPDSQRLSTLEDQNRDLETLLLLPHARFWASALNNESMKLFLESFLRFAPRPYELLPSPTASSRKDDEEACAKLENSLARRVLLLVLRLVSRIESSTSFWSQSGYAKHVGASSLITVTGLLDVASIFMPANQRTVQSILQRAFDALPFQLATEMAEVTASFTDLLNRLSKQLDGSDPIVKSNSWDLPKLFDMHHYFEDIAFSLRNFWDAAPTNLTNKILEGEGLLLALMQSYNGGLSALARSFTLLSKQSTVSQSVQESFRLQHNRIRLNWLWLGFRFLDQKYFSHLAVKSSTEHAQILDQLLTELLVVLEEEQESYDEISHHLFIHDLNARYKISRTIRELSRNNSPDRVEFVRLALGGSASSRTTSDAGQPEVFVEGLLQDEKLIEQMSLISQVKDLLPDLGDGFVDECLRFYNGQVEAVINHIFEDSLPEPLKSLDRKLALQSGKGKEKAPTVSLPKKVEKNSVQERSNVFNNDEFDLFSKKNVDTSKVYIKSKDNKTLDAKTIFSGANFDRSRIIESQYDEYEDEYDDTYDQEDIQFGKLESGSDNTDPDVFDPLLAFDRSIVRELLKAHAEDITVFERVSSARRSPARAALRDRTGLTDEQIEGWNMMMLRHPPKPRTIEEMQLLQEEVPELTQNSLNADGSKDEDSDEEDNRQDKRPGSQKSRGGRNKYRAANHNRKDASLRKMNRGMGAF